MVANCRVIQWLIAVITFMWVLEYPNIGHLRSPKNDTKLALVNLHEKYPIYILRSLMGHKFLSMDSHLLRMKSQLLKPVSLTPMFLRLYVQDTCNWIPHD